MYSLQYRPQMDHNKYEGNEGAAAFGRHPFIFVDMGYGPSVACTVDSQPKVNGLKVKTLGPMDVKIIRSKPSIWESKIGQNLQIQVQIG